MDGAGSSTGCGSRYGPELHRVVLAMMVMPVPTHIPIRIQTHERVTPPDEHLDVGPFSFRATDNQQSRVRKSVPSQLPVTDAGNRGCEHNARNISRSWKIMYWNIMVYESGRPRYSIITRYNGYNPERQKWLITGYKPI